RNSDIIFVMQGGILVESGTHHDLIGRPNGVYYALVSAQEAATAAAANAQRHTPEIPLLRYRSCSSGFDDSVFVRAMSAVTKSAGSAVFVENEHFAVDEEAEEKKRVEQISKTYKVPWLRLFGLSKPEFAYYLPSILGAILSGVAMPLEALLLAQALKYFFDPDVDSMMDGIVRTSLGFVGIAIGTALGKVGQFWGFAFIGEHLTKRVRTACYGKMLRQEIAYFDDPAHAPGRLTSTLGTYALKLNVLTGTQLGIFAQLAATAIAGVIISFSASPKLAAVMLATLPLLAAAGAIGVIFVTREHGIGKKDDSSGQANQIASEAVQNLRTLRALTAEVRTRDLFEMLITKSAIEHGKPAFISGFFYGLSNSMTYAAVALGFWYGAVLIDTEGLAFDVTIQAVMGVFLSAVGIGQALAFLHDIKEARTAAHDIFELLDRRSECDPFCPDGRKASIFNVDDDYANNTNVKIVFDDVDFAYPHRPEVQILKGLNLEIPAGQTVALVGPSGGGKSTVFALLQRFYDPDAGRIYVESADLDAVNVSWWRSQCGVVSQEPVLFDLSLGDN
ncbi:(ABC) transporter, partial [Perkinsus olseni]